jgi:molybdate transport system substrate-binding protein
MMTILQRLVFALLFSGIWSSVSADDKLTIAAASDLRFALEDILRDFKAQYAKDLTGVSVQVIYGSSGKISNQIRQGAPFDVFFSADQRFTAELFQDHFTTDAGTVYARGRLVLWSPKHDMRAVALTALTREKYRKIAIAQPSHAPYGERARQSLTSAGVWSQLESKLVYGENIAQTAQLAQSGAADAAIIALSLVKNPHLNAESSRQYQLIDASTHQPLLQSYVLTKTGASKKPAKQLVRFVGSNKAREILALYGFELPEPTQEAEQ